MPSKREYKGKHAHMISTISWGQLLVAMFTKRKTSAQMLVLSVILLQFSDTVDRRRPVYTSKAIELSCIRTFQCAIWLSYSTK